MRARALWFVSMYFVSDIDVSSKWYLKSTTSASPLKPPAGLTQKALPIDASVAEKSGCLRIVDEVTRLAWVMIPGAYPAQGRRVEAEGKKITLSYPER